MKCPPYLLRLRIEDRERVRFRLWFPLFLLWPLILVLFILGVLLALLVDLLTAVSGRRPGYARLLVGCLQVMAETSGTEVSVTEGKEDGRTVAFKVR